MPVVNDLLICEKCGNKHIQINITSCSVCGYDLGAPNVNELALKRELDALEERYRDAKVSVDKNNRSAILNNFEQFFIDNSKGVMNMSLAVLDNWICKEKEYKNYYHRLDHGEIQSKMPEEDRKRSLIDAFFFGSKLKDYYFAAISLSQTGLQSYGDYSVILNNLFLYNRGSVLEENSYNFVTKHGINFEDLKIPLGYRSDWENKLKLAVAKLHERIVVDNEDDFCKAVLKCAGVKSEDEFIEIHIYKEIAPQAISQINIPNRGRNRKEQFILKVIEEKLPGKIVVI